MHFAAGTNSISKIITLLILLWAIFIIFVLRFLNSFFPSFRQAVAKVLLNAYGIFICWHSVWLHIYLQRNSCKYEILHLFLILHSQCYLKPVQIAPASSSSTLANSVRSILCLFPLEIVAQFAGAASRRTAFRVASSGLVTLYRFIKRQNPEYRLGDLQLFFINQSPLDIACRLSLLLSL